MLNTLLGKGAYLQHIDSPTRYTNGFVGSYITKRFHNVIIRPSAIVNNIFRLKEINIILRKYSIVLLSAPV